MFGSILVIVWSWILIVGWVKLLFLWLQFFCLSFDRLLELVYLEWTERTVWFLRIWLLLHKCNYGKKKRSRFESNKFYYFVFKPHDQKLKTITKTTKFMNSQSLHKKIKKFIFKPPMFEERDLNKKLYSNNSKDSKNKPIIIP